MTTPGQICRLDILPFGPHNELVCQGKAHYDQETNGVLKEIVR